MARQLTLSDLQARQWEQHRACVVPGVGNPATFSAIGGAWMPDPRWVDATGPCPSNDCENGVLWDDMAARCPKCKGTGRKRVALRVPCPKWDWIDGRQRNCRKCNGTGFVVVARATVTLLPVYDLDRSRDAISRDEVHAWVNDTSGVLTWAPGPVPSREWTRMGRFDPLPVAGRDWVAVFGEVS